MEHQNIQTLILKEGKFFRNQTNDNGPNEKLTSHYNEVNYVWIMKYVTKTFLPHHMISLFVEVWGAFKVSSG